jgi:hypothetical protein
LTDDDNVATVVQARNSSGRRVVCTQSDAGAQAWGIVVGSRAFYGRWAPHQRDWSSAARESYPLLQALMRDPEAFRDSFLVASLDNAGDVLSLNYGRAGTRTEQRLLSAIYACTDDLGVEFVAWWNSRRLNGGLDDLSKCLPADACRWAHVRGLELTIVEPTDVLENYVAGSLAPTVPAAQHTEPGITRAMAGGAIPRATPPRAHNPVAPPLH